MDKALEKRNEDLLKAMDRGEVPDSLKALVTNLRELAVTFARPFPQDLTDAKLAKAAYFSKGPKSVLKLIEELFDLRMVARAKK